MFIQYSLGQFRFRLGWVEAWLGKNGWGLKLSPSFPYTCSLLPFKYLPTYLTAHPSPFIRIPLPSLPRILAYICTFLPFIVSTTLGSCLTCLRVALSLSVTWNVYNFFSTAPSESQPQIPDRRAILSVSNSHCQLGPKNINKPFSPLPRLRIYDLGKHSSTIHLVSICPHSLHASRSVSILVCVEYLLISALPQPVCLCLSNDSITDLQIL